MSEKDPNKPKKNTGFRLRPENINRNGRPKKEESLTHILKDLIQANAVEGPGGNMISIKEGLALRLVQVAMKGDMNAMKYAWDRIDGMMKGDGGMNVTINLVTDADDADV